ncbi:MAG TPA: hypothetical protein VGC21_23645 [Telluria sp.]
MSANVGRIVALLAALLLAGAGLFLLLQAGRPGAILLLDLSVQHRLVLRALTWVFLAAAFGSLVLAVRRKSGARI